MLNVKRAKKIVPHCETIYPNNECLYISRGCTGCMLPGMKKQAETCKNLCKDLEEIMKKWKFFREKY